MEKPRCWEDEGEERGKSPKVEIVTSSRAKEEKLEGRTGVKYPIKKKKKIHKLEVESESGSASKTAVPVLFNRRKKKVLFCTMVSIRGKCEVLGQVGVVETCAYTMKEYRETKK